MPGDAANLKAMHDHVAPALARDLAILRARLLAVPVPRRRALALLGAGGLGLALTACSSSGSSPAGSSTTAGGATSTAAAGIGIPEETAGPFPGDGSNGPDVLTESGVVRQDLRSSFGGLSGSATGTTATIDLTVVGTDGEPRPGAAVYLWHCDDVGRYSLYGEGVTDQNWLRGVQVADDVGRLSFTTVFPGAYPGRWPHAHFEVFSSVEDATSGGAPLVTSQLALPQEACEAVYADTDGYGQSASNLAAMSLATDMVFADGVDQQLATVEDDLTIALAVTVAGAS